MKHSNLIQAGMRAIFIALLTGITASISLSAVTLKDVTKSGTIIEQFDKFELTFNLTDVQHSINPSGNTQFNCYWMYDPYPAASSVPAGIGINVDAYFLPPGETDWSKAIAQPAFYYQDYQRSDLMRWSRNSDWLHPVGNALWKVRFAPTKPGIWQYKIRVTNRFTDNLATSQYEYIELVPEQNTFQCIASSRRGFVRVSPKDCRYFETSDGKYLNLVGCETIYLQRTPDGTWDAPGSTFDLDILYPQLKENKMNILRVWWNCSQGFPALFGISGQGGYGGWINTRISRTVAKPGQIFSFMPSYPTAPISLSLQAKPYTRYKITFWIKTENITGTGDYGVALEVENDKPITPKVTGSRDWTQFTGYYTTSSYPGFSLKFKKYNCTDGNFYITDVECTEETGNANIVQRPSPNAYQYINQYEAWRADYQVELARKNDIYLKIILGEKQDQCFGSIGADGKAADFSYDNFYGNSTHPSRVYQQYYWRYIIARYGYATNIHSFELNNEGDPFNGNHYDAAQAMAKFFDDTDPNKHLTTTSCWHSFPTREFWANPNYPNIGYADWHRNIGPFTANNNWNIRYCYNGWTSVFGNWSGATYYFTTDTSVFRSAPASLYFDNKLDPKDSPSVFLAYSALSMPIAITPGHTYTLKWWVKGENLVPRDTGPESRIFMNISGKNGWWSNQFHISGADGGNILRSGTFDWTQRSYTFKAPDNMYYLLLEPTTGRIKGKIWFDDITLYDETDKVDVPLPNGNFDDTRIDYDTGLISESLGYQVGYPQNDAVSTGNRQVKMPVMDSNCRIEDYENECDDLKLDTQAIWYKKFLWGQVNHFGTINLYYTFENYPTTRILPYAKAYQTFMSDIPLNNGKYQNANAVTSTRTLRAIGQKDLTNNRAHLWIDNKPYTWRNIVDGVQVPPVSGTVKISGFSAGSYKVEWWNTSTGEISNVEEVECTDGTITLSIKDLISDVACKIYPMPPQVSLHVSVPSTNVKPGEIVTVTVEFRNNGKFTARNVLITAKVPEGMDYVNGSGGNWDPQSGYVSWLVDSIESGATGSRTFQAKVR